MTEKATTAHRTMPIAGTVEERLELPGGRVLAPLARRLEWLLVPGYRWIARHRSGLSKLVPGRSRRRADALVGACTAAPHDARLVGETGRGP